MIEKVVIIGAGNLATQLALAFHEKGLSCLQVYSRKPESAQQLAVLLNASFTNRIADLRTDADIYIIAVKDSAIPEVLENLNLSGNSLIVHTAGSIPMSILNGFSENTGVFYPLQTLSKSRKIDFSDVPVCIEANHPSNLIKLQKLAGRISNAVHQINSEERKTLHLAAVFVNNFVNHFYTIGAEILKDKKLDFSLLKPLIAETAKKIEMFSPSDAQTGPAKRHDQQVIGEHIKMLQNKPELQKLYSFVSESIFQHYQQ